MMKIKLLFLLLLFSLVKLKAQIISFSDPDFKQVLLTKNCVSFDYVYNGINNSEIPYTTTNADLNGNGEIEVSEAEQVKLMVLNTDVPKLINSLDEIKYFKNITVLSFYDQNISNGNVDLSGLTNLKELICSSSNISSLNLTGVTLDLIIARENKISSFDFQSQTQLRYFDFSGNFNLNSGNIILKDLPNLYQFVLENCNISNIDISNIPKLEGFSINDNPLPNYDFSAFTNLMFLGIANTGRTTLDVSMLLKLKTLNCSNNNLVNLDVTKNTMLEHLSCQNCGLTTLDISKNLMLKTINFSNNNITDITDFKILPNLESVEANNSLISEADFSNCKNGFPSNNLAPSVLFSCMDCSNLEILNIKNGAINYIYLPNTTKLKYICIDESEAGIFDQFSPTPSTVSINSYCSPNPGGNYNSIAGNVKLDENTNGCEDTDANFSKLKIKISKEGQDLGTTITNSEGKYELFIDSGSFNITPILENPNYYTVSPPSATINFADINNNTEIQNFCIVPNGTHNDLEVQFMPVSQARPGFDATYRFIFLNKGNTTLSGNVNLDYQGNRMSFVSSDLPVDVHQNSNLLWYFTDLKPFEQKSFLVTFKINSPTHPTNPVNAGDKLFFWSRIIPIFHDETPLDNLMTLCQTVVNSIDPNDKTCLEGDIITPDLVGNEVHYLIRFENTGTANAVNVVVKDMIDTEKFDIESLQPIKSSHPYRMTITEGNKLEFFFENIQLPFDDANNDGYILFKIKTKPTLVVGDTFSNKADIYFDYNFPVETNNAITTVQNALSTSELTKSEISVFPNPAKDILNFKTVEKIMKAEIYDASGRLVTTMLGITNNQLNVSSLKSGSYLIKIASDKKSYQTKFIKQ